MAAREIKLRYDGACQLCGSELPKGTVAWHFPDEKKVECSDCYAANAPSTPTITHAAPGASAQREYERRDTNRRVELQDRWGSRLGKVVWLLEDEAQTTSSWSKGARGERKVGDYLEKKLAGTPCRVLHDRGIPGSRANIDHIVVGPAGVTVIDAKNVSGSVRATTSGFGKRRQQHLVVDGRDRTKLISGVSKQVDVVRAVLEEMEPPVATAVVGAICWWNTNGLPLLGTNKIEVDGVRVLGPRAAAAAAGSSGPLTQMAIAAIAEFLDSRLPPA